MKETKWNYNQNIRALKSVVYCQGIWLKSFIKNFANYVPIAWTIVKKINWTPILRSIFEPILNENLWDIYGGKWHSTEFNVNS